MKTAPEILKELAQYSTVSVDSSPELVGRVESAAKEDDEKRVENEQDALRRKPGLRPMPTAENDRSSQLTPWEVLHTLGRAIALSRRGAGRGLAEHWGALKYSQALIGEADRYMRLSAEGKETAEHYKTLQSSELGTGFALSLAEKFLTRRHPDCVVSIVPADVALRAGWALNAKDKGLRQAHYRYRPQFFAEIWKPGERSLAIPIACKGNHSGAATSHGQIASAAAHVEAVHIGDWNETPSLVFSTELPIDGPLSRARPPLQGKRRLAGNLAKRQLGRSAHG